MAVGRRARTADRAVEGRRLGARHHKCVLSALRSRFDLRWSRHDAPHPDCSCGLYADSRPRAPHEKILALLDRIADARASSCLKARVLELVARQAWIAHDRRLAPATRAFLADHLGEAWASCGEHTVIGAVALEGRVCVHASGLRGARARVVALAFEPYQRALVAEIGALYGAEAVPTVALRLRSNLGSKCPRRLANLTHCRCTRRVFTYGQGT
jgi:hypothetical protein